MKRIFVLLLSIVCCALGGVWAVPAKPIVKTLIQPDGSELKVRLVGDENGHYYITPEGNVVERDKDGWYVVGNGQQREGERLQMPRKRVHSSTVDEQRRAPHQAERGLVILVEFSDVSFSKTRQNFDDLLNKEGYNYNGATGSARDYFRDASNGQYVPEFDVYGPYRLDSVMSYYGQNDRSGLDMHPDQMVVDAVAKLAADSLVDINFADYDTDNDGYMDNLFVYYAGYGENETDIDNEIWPHAWEVYEEYVKGQLVYDGKQIKGYACASELQDASGVVMCGIGTFCHEFGHVLGLPDFYDTEYSRTHRTLGNWDIMDAGAYLNDGNTPPTYSAHERFYLGWLTPEILNETGDFELEELQKSNKAYIVTSTGEHNLDGGKPNPATYFLLENRQKTGWDRYLPGHGLMITKTIYNENNWYNNIPNNNRYLQGYDLIEADGKAPNNDYGKGGDLFPGTANVTSYSPYENYSVINIVEKEGVISFSFVGEAELSVDEEISMATVVMVKRNGVCELEGVSSGAMVYCFDAVGRRVWSRTVLTEPFNFVEPQGFYLLKIVDKSVEFVLKGI